MDEEDRSSIPLDGQVELGEIMYRQEEEEEIVLASGNVDGQISMDNLSTKINDDTKNINYDNLDRSQTKIDKNEINLDSNQKYLDEKKANLDKNEPNLNFEGQKSGREELDNFFKEESVDKHNDDDERKELDEFLMDDHTQIEENYYGEGYEGSIRTSFDDDFEGGLADDNQKNIEKNSKNIEKNIKNTSKNIKNISKNEKKQKNEQIDMFFENDDNAKVRSEIESINSSLEELNKDVGRGVFASVTGDGKFSKAIEEKVFIENTGERIEDGLLLKNLDTVLHESMIPYSEHVILDRALPRVEDGLKPVQRRILYSMLELGVTPDKPFRKSARIVGDCLGKYHPHGDSSVYDAMVRMAQPFNCNEVLVSGHGNFGSVDGDSAAAMRYTEARLAPLALELLRDLDKNTVKWGLNFDDTSKEPEMLPGRFPNLLVNGSSGIAVGLATNIPPHNLAECIDGVVAFIDNPKISLKEMLKIIKGPDFPTGGYILDNSEIYSAYEIGRGRIFLRAKMHVEGEETDKRSIVITELPYQVNKASLLQKIAQMKDESLHGFEDIAEIRDESDREGQRAVIRLKKDASLGKIYNNLLKYTDLQGTFGINMVAIAGGKPRQMGLLDILSYYSEYQREIVLRRSKYDLEQAKEREHILSGLIIAIKNIDAVVKIIKTSQNTTDAKKRLKEKFLLSDKQTQAILDMRLARLTSLEVNKLIDEVKRLKELIKELTSIVSSTRKQYEIVKQELLAIKRQYKRDRRTKFMKDSETIHSQKDEEEKPKEMIVVKSALDTLKAIPLKQYNMANKELKENSSLNEIHVLKLNTLSTSNIIAISNLGNCFKTTVKSMGENRYKDKGTAEYSVFKDMQKKERIIGIFDEKDFSENVSLVFISKQGLIKKSKSSEYILTKKSFAGIKLKEGDELVSVMLDSDKTYTIVLITKDGMILNARVDDVPIQGRVSSGVKGIALGTGDLVISACLAYAKEEILVITDRGYSKRIDIKKVDESVRYRKGLKILSASKDYGKIVKLAKVLNEEVNVAIVDSDKELHFLSSTLVPIENRQDKGKPFDKLKKLLIVEDAFISYI